MAYSPVENKFKELLEYPKGEDYRQKNARKVNSKKYPDGYIYILQIEEFDLFKIGVSQNVKRRVRDIRAANPFCCKLIYVGSFYDVYTLEEQIHDLFSKNKHKGEWFKIHTNEIIDLINSLGIKYLKKHNLLLNG